MLEAFSLKQGYQDAKRNGNKQVVQVVNAVHPVPPNERKRNHKHDHRHDKAACSGGSSDLRGWKRKEEKVIKPFILVVAPWLPRR